MEYTKSKYLSIKNELTYKKVINYLFIGLALCIPVSKAGISFFEILLILTWTLEGKWKDKFKSYKTSKIIIMIFVFIGFMILSILWANNTLDALMYIQKYRHFLIILILYTELDRKNIKYIISAFLVGMLISEIMSYGIFFEFWKYKNTSPLDPAPFMDHISYSVFLSFTAMILLNRIFFESKVLVKFSYLFFFLTVTINLFLNGGRTGQFAYIIALVYIFFRNIKYKMVATIAATIGLIFIVFVAYLSSPNFHNRINLLHKDYINMINKNDYSGSLGVRASLWIMGIDEITDGFSLGNGIGNEMNNIEWYANKHNFDKSIYAKYADHHNMFITYGIILGEVGLTIIFLLFYYIYTLPINNVMYKTLNVVFIIIFSLWSFTGITFHAMDPMTFFALFVGLFNAIYHLEKTNQ